MVRHGIQQGAAIAEQRRLALVTSSYPVDAADLAGAFVPDFAGALARKGCEVTVLTPDKPGSKRQPADHAVRWFSWAGSRKPVVDLSLRSPADLWRIVSLVREGERALRGLMEESPVDAVLALWAVPAGYIVRRACRDRVPYSVWALGSDIHVWARRPGAAGIVRRVLADAAHLFADGLALAKEVTAIAGRDCMFLPSTRRLPDPVPPTESLGPGLKFLFVGRLEPVKGPDILVDAFLQVLAAGTDCSLTMCGSGSLKPALTAQVDSARAAQRARFVSGLSGAEIAGLMAASDCLVIPSRDESIPVVFSEALQAGIPLLVTDVGDLGGLARAHGLGNPVVPGNVGALAAAMTSFARDPAGRRVAYQAVRPGLLQMFDVDQAAGRFLSTIQG